MLLASVGVLDSGQAAELRRGVDKVRRCEAFLECAVVRSQCGVSLAAAAVPLPKPGQAHRGAELPPSDLLSPGRLDDLVETALRPGLVGRLVQQQFSLSAAKFGFLETVNVTHVTNRVTRHTGIVHQRDYVREDLLMVSAELLGRLNDGNVFRSADKIRFTIQTAMHP